ncbi:unnamed protein product [Mytilus edulis]|uniref:Integrase zinc-binding domain-containing protein n=1 Tax=Mytilus edulis TaxID=6550 RepID=A0A8S3VJ65_MYTED|nr:unnamed protein product [Mytilus edulis]
MVANSVANINEKRQMPVLIVNTTNRTYMFRRGIAIGRALPVLEENVVSLESTQEHSEIENVFETDLNVPDVHMGIASYNCKIEWLAGTDNTIADYLSRRPPGQEGNQNQSETIKVDISDKAFQINTLNSNEFNPKDFASCDYKEDDQLSVKECTIPGYDMKIEQSLDIELSEIINQINTGKASRSVDNKHIIINDILYYISHPDDDLKFRLYIPLQLRNEVIKSYHDNLSHLGIDKCHDSIRQKYFWPKLYKELNSYINSCVICQSQSAETFRSPSEVGNINIKPSIIVGWIITSKVISDIEENSYITALVEFGTSIISEFSYCREINLSPRLINEWVKVIELNAMESGDQYLFEYNQIKFIMEGAAMMKQEPQANDVQTRYSKIAVINHLEDLLKKKIDDLAVKTMYQAELMERNTIKLNKKDNVINSQIVNDDQVIKEEVENSLSDYDVSDIDDNMSSTHSFFVTSEMYDIEDNMSVDRMADNEESFAQLESLYLWKPLLIIYAEMRNGQTLLGVPEHELAQDVVTRWNSTQAMLSRLVEQHRTLTDILLDEKVTKKADSAVFLPKTMSGN